MYPTPEGVGFIAPPRPSPVFITSKGSKQDSSRKARELILKQVI